MKKLISLLPSRVWHILFCYLATFVSIWLAVGLALGRESMHLTSIDKDTINDLIADGVGIVLALLTMLLL